MKKGFLIIFIVMSNTFYSNAQSNAIKTGPVAFAFGDINFGYEHQFSKNFSITIGTEYFYSIRIFNESSIFGIGGGIRYYMIPKDNLAGFYINPRYKYNTLGFEIVGATIGYQWHWNDNLILDMGIGPSKFIITGKYSETIPSVWPMVTLAIGYAF